MTNKVKSEIWDAGRCRPDYEFWRRAAYWTLEEGVALMLEKEPTLFNSKTLRDAPVQNRIVGLFYKWLELSERAADAGIITSKPNPIDFLEWIYPLWYQNDDDFPLGILSDGLRCP